MRSRVRPAPNREYIAFVMNARCNYERCPTIFGAGELRHSLCRANYVGPVNKVCRDYTAVSRYCYNAAYLTTNSNLAAVRAVIVRNGRSQNIIDKRGPRGSLAAWISTAAVFLSFLCISRGATASEKLKPSVSKSLRPRRNMSERPGNASRARSDNYEQFEWRFLDYVLQGRLNFPEFPAVCTINSYPISLYNLHTFCVTNNRHVTRCER